MDTILKTNGRKNFLEARLKIAQEKWEKAHEKWIRANEEEIKDAELKDLKIMNSQTKMAFCNGQRKLLKELIVLEDLK